MKSTSLRHFSTRSFRFACLAAIFAAAGYADAPATTATGSAAETVVVKRGDLSLSVTTDGWYEALDAFEVRVKPEAYEGKLEIQAIVPEGAVVKAGDQLLKLDDRDFQRQLAAAENEHLLAGANLAKAEADVTQGDAADALAMKVQQQAVEMARKNLDWWEKVDGPQQVQMYDLQVKANEDSVGDQEDELQQLKNMYKSEELTNATADIVVKRAVRQYERSKVGLDMTRARVERQKDTELLEGRQRVEVGLEQQTQAMTALQSAQAQGKAARSSALFQARQAYDAAKRKLDELRADAGTFAVTAKSDGVVFFGKLEQGKWQGNDPGSLEPGDAITPDQVVLTVVPAGRLRVVAGVSEDHVARIKAGDPVRVVPVSIPESEQSGRCLSPALVPSAEGKYEVRVDLAQPVAGLLPGQRVNVTIDVDDAKSVLLLPKAAVSNGRVRAAVDVTRDVVTGRTDGEHVEIVKGLSEGDEVMAKFDRE